MSFTRWLRTANHDSAARTGSPLRTRCRPRLEALEDRFCPAYSVVDLGALGGTWSDAFALNDAAQVVGQVHTTTAYFWQNGAMTDLGTAGHDSSAAFDINDSGQVVGAAGGLLVYGDEVPPSHAFLWQDGVMTDIGGSHSLAYAINNAGQIAGYAVSANGGPGAVVWEGGVMYQLNSLLPGGAVLQMAAAHDINDQGQIVGLAYVNGLAHHFLFTDDDGIFANGGGHVTDLGTLDAYEAPRLNNAGQVIAGRYLHSNGTVTNLGFVGRGINDAGQVVGASVLWQNGQTTHLNNLIDPAGGWDLRYARDINGRGEIVGTGFVGGQHRAFLLTHSSTPGLTIGDAVVSEGDSGTTSAVFTVSLSEPSDQVVTVAYTTANGSAAAGSDYEAAAGTLTFQPGETTKSLVVQVHGDVRDEDNETFQVKLSGATNAFFTRSQAQGTILDNDPLPTLSITDASVSEGHSGLVNAVFTVTLAGPTDRTVYVSFTTGDGTAKASSNDYLPRSGVVTFYPGETTRTLSVPVNGDTRDETDEHFVIVLSGPSNALIVDGNGVGTIRNDDPPPALSISDVTLAEGASGIKYFVFRVSLSAASDKTVSVNFATANGTARVADNDYVAATGSLTFAPGEKTQTITVQVKADRKKEGNETFFLNLFGANNALLADSQGLGTILNDD